MSSGITTNKFFLGGGVPMNSNCKPDVKFSALVLVKVAYKKGTIDKKTYQAVMKKYGGAFNDK